MKLLIVESPTKSKTLAQYLGDDFEVVSCNGHIRDLPKSKMGIDIEHDFKPQYVIPTKKRKTVTNLKKIAAKAKTVILAVDEDREGEAIAWHLEQILESVNNPQFQRIAFHEITKEAIQNALKNPRDIDMNLVNAQQARRILDRLVGYELSPLLWKKLVKGLSAGRVQSPAVRLIVEREREIKKFKPEEYWSIEAELEQQTPLLSSRTPSTVIPHGVRDDKGDVRDDKGVFTVRLSKIDDKTLKKLDIKNKEQADEIVKNLEKTEYTVTDIRKKQTMKNPFPPYTTSTLQQAASRVLNFSARQTMFIAQQLYETGLISYPRTDSLNLASAFINQAQQFITNEYGNRYTYPRHFKTKSKLAQEAHEAIRPTSAINSPEKVEKGLEKKFLKLYELIWRQAVASQMNPAKIDKTSVDISANNYMLRATGSVIKFDGWLKLYPQKLGEKILPELSINEILNCIQIIPAQHFTEPPPRYSEARLVKTLEEYGIGRPSTYAPIISTILSRNYVIKEGGRFKPTEMGMRVNDLLTKHFPNIVDYKFTAKMEDRLDAIAQGEKDQKTVLSNFYKPFKQTLMQKEEQIEKQFKDEKTDKTCPQCGKDLVIKMGRFGKFLACTGFPDCRYTKSLEQKSSDQPNDKTGVKCPQCKEGEFIKKRTRKGKFFYGCSIFPKCKNALWYEPTGDTCEKCGSLLVKFGKDEKIKCSNKECK
ncbi:type I DNA topoisomerase [Patescibacteria group bacterium AH-259-L05]|nr:type I DNA topoisomerase [Patescibacteria group bacterium AH-259-L05]